MLRRDPSLLNALREATELYEDQVELVVPYLEGRGISQESAVKFRLGFVAEPFSVEHEKYRGRLAIPYVTRAGVYTIRFRTLTDDRSKYLSIPKVTMPLFNVNSLFVESDVLLITEGELDALVATETLGVPAVGCPGASGWRDYFSRCVADYATVVVAGDGDEAGRSFATSVADSLPNGRAVICPDGHDVNSMVLADGPYGTLEHFGLA